MNQIISKTTTGNYMQTSTHCPTCHQDYFYNHQCSTFTSGACQRCQNIKEVEQMLNDKKYCPYCGHKL